MLLELSCNRRTFIKLATSTLAAVWAEGPWEVAQAQTQQFITTRQPWTSRYWFPAFAETAQKKGLPTMEGDNGPLYWYTQYANGDDRAYRWYVDIFLPGLTAGSAANADWVGFCNGLAVAGITEQAPDINDPIKVGLKVAQHAGDPLYELKRVEQLKFFIEHGQPVMVDLPEIPGEWYRVAYGISRDNSLVMVTNFGAEPEPKILPTWMIRSAWLVLSDNDPRAQDATIRTKVREWRNPFLDPAIVNLIAYS